MNAHHCSRRPTPVQVAHLLALTLALCGLGTGACSRAKLTPTHGRAYHEAFAIQDANPNRKGNKSINGLDSQEASIIAGSYRKGLSPKIENTGTGSQLLMVNPNRGGGAEVLAPSVPQGN
jgi:hypothetical protein